MTKKIEEMTDAELVARYIEIKTELERRDITITKPKDFRCPECGSTRGRVIASDPVTMFECRDCDWDAVEGS